ncbi:DUF6904 family protein [Mucilaginibacter lacusdianchii]|uniref:DUF6904 family protein n=1 Tax=Mucilaginibacter lacusdianchii TaxID=2684211 RepID=UPI00131DE7B3|nr:hypothetical protein [Mucilaginibacter sp. JXJ CY 39]
MFSATCTKRGTGITIWGDEDDFRFLYDLVHKLAGDGEWTDDAKGGRTRILHSIAYEVRHAHQETRLMRPVEIASGVHVTEFGFNYSWIDLLFTLACLRFNAAYTATDEEEQTCLSRLEFWTKKALHEYDGKGAQHIETFIGPHALNVNHEWVWHFNQQIQMDYLEMNANKTRFRNIPYLLNQTEKWGPTYNNLNGKIARTAQELGCGIFEIDYTGFKDVKW